LFIAADNDRPDWQAASDALAAWFGGSWTVEDIPGDGHNDFADLVGGRDLEMAMPDAARIHHGREPTFRRARAVRGSSISGAAGGAHP
jgi:hypothetical protein